MLIQKLQSCGLTKNEAQIYLALLQKKEFVASEISSIIPVGRTRIYEVIPQLVVKGLCNEIIKDGKKIYRAVEPEVALDNLVSFFHNRLNEEFAKKKEILDEKRNSFSEIENELKELYSSNLGNSSDIDYIELIKEKNQIRNKWRELQASVKYELLSFNKAPYSISLSQNLSYHEEILKKNKITERGIYEYGKDISSAGLEDFIKIVDEYSRLGEEVRVIEELPMKLIIIDSLITMLALNDPVSMKPSITTMIITHPSFAKAQIEVFESYWNKSIPLDEFKNLSLTNNQNQYE